MDGVSVASNAAVNTGRLWFLLFGGAFATLHPFGGNGVGAEELGQQRIFGEMGVMISSFFRPRVSFLKVL
jgi:hypothetical protein